MTDVDHTLGETITSFRPSTMSSLEAKAFASSEDPEQEIRELSDAAERGSITARMRIGALLTGLGPQRWREARGYWLAALEECENWLEDYYGPRSKSGGVSAGTDQVLLETAAGAIHGMLGELAIRLESDEEAITHLERGVHYQHSESSLWLALLYKSRGRLDLAQFLLTSVLDDRASDAAYLLGDLLETKGLHDLADIYYRRAAAKGHARAASHVPAGATDGPVGYPDLTETISYGHGWSAEIHQLEGGVTIMWGDTEIRELEATSNLSGVEQLYIGLFAVEGVAAGRGVGASVPG